MCRIKHLCSSHSAAFFQSHFFEVSYHIDISAEIMDSRMKIVSSFRKTISEYSYINLPKLIIIIEENTKYKIQLNLSSNENIRMKGFIMKPEVNLTMLTMVLSELYISMRSTSKSICLVHQINQLIIIRKLLLPTR